MSSTTDVTRHYQRDDLAGAILVAARAGLEPGEVLTSRHLAPASEFHVGGLESTRRFIPMLGIAPGMAVLDVGCGVGGTARFVAETCGAIVTGIDLTPAYVEAAQALSEAVGLGGSTSFHCGSALAMPFDDRAFDAAFTLHVAMNIEDKARLYREVARVLKPGAVFGVYDMVAGSDDGAFVFPVPWAAGPATSFLATPAEMRVLLDEAGFTIEHEEDRRDHALDFFARQRALAAAGPSSLSLRTLIGEGFAERMANIVANISARRCGPWEFIARRR